MQAVSTLGKPLRPGATCNTARVPLSSYMYALEPSGVCEQALVIGSEGRDVRPTGRLVRQPDSKQESKAEPDKATDDMHRTSEGAKKAEIVDHWVQQTHVGSKVVQLAQALLHPGRGLRGPPASPWAEHPLARQSLALVAVARCPPHFRRRSTGQSKTARSSTRAQNDAASSVA